MDVNRLSMGDKIAGGAAIALLLIMFIFKWFGIEVEGNVAGFDFGGSTSWNAWASFSFIDIILLITILAALAMVYLHASSTRVDLPVSLSVVVAALGALSTLLIIFRIISPPDFDITGGFDPTGTVDYSSTREIGAFLGLLAAAALTYGGFRAMQEEGTSFQEAGDQLRDRADSSSGSGRGGPGAGSGGGTGTPPPPPAGGTAPPPPPPPPSSNA
jgi:hypothetical protein